MTEHERTDDVEEPAVEDVAAEHEPSEITYSEQFYPARPRSLRPRARLRPDGSPTHGEELTGEPVGTNPFYVAWLQRESMLYDANTISGQFSGQGSMWQNPYANPSPEKAVHTAPVWFTAYPMSLVTKPGSSFLGTLADPELWSTFEQIGITAIHTGPVKRAGGLDGWKPTPSVDGHFDRISTQIDSTFGTEADFRRMCEIAAEHGGTIIDDIVPGHTGKGPDFRLAEMKVGDYPGIYHMVEIPEEDWHYLPDVPPGRDSLNLDVETEDRLAKAGYIIGQLQRVIFHAPGVKDTNWSVTAPVVGPDGVARRWVYLHYFKEGQPSINWLDPTFAGMRLVIGDALHSIGDLGSGALRLDANGFLGVEKSAEGLPAWSEGHPLSHAANHVIAGMVRKVGGFTFQELNLTMEDIRDTGRVGADLSYDFVNRPAYHHALATGSTEFLRLTLRTSLETGVEPVSLVHALQNHDELTYELVHWATLHRDDVYPFRHQQVTGAELAETIRADLTQHLTGEADYNRVFTTNGIACTSASVIAAIQGHRTLDEITDEHVEDIRRAHLLLAMFNAWQPGVFALSGWDLLGMLPVPAE
jgi:trehalose synthase